MEKLYFLLKRVAVASLKTKTHTSSAIAFLRVINELISFCDLIKRKLILDFNASNFKLRYLFNSKFYTDYFIIPFVKSKQNTITSNFLKVETHYKNSNYQY